MADFLEIGTTGLQGLVEIIQGYHKYYKGDVDDNGNSFMQEEKPTTPNKRIFDKSFFDVRPSICVCGFHRESVNYVKKEIQGLVVEPLALESFTIKKTSDIKDGAFLVPKIILVGLHTPGRKLLDEEDDQGQLDFLYDEAVAVGSDVMVVYMGLPKIIYPHMRHMVYHPKISDMLFPSQPILQELARENCFMTVTAGANLTSMQKNLLREWINKPVGQNHPVYKTSDYLKSHSDGELMVKPSDMIGSYTEWLDDEMGNVTYRPAEEHHPMAERKHKKRKEKKKKKEKQPKADPHDHRREKQKKPLETLAEEEYEVSLEMNSYDRPYENVALGI